MTLDPVTLALALGAMLAGTAAGWLHFRTLSRVTDLLVAGRIAGVGLQLARLALLAAFLWFCAKGGALVLLAGALGVLLGRALVLRKAG